MENGKWRVPPVPGDDSIMPGATTHPPPPITFNHEAVLYPSSKNYQVDSDNNNLGESNMVKEKVINNP